MGSTRVLECIYFLWASYKMKVSKCILKELIVALEDGYLEKLFLKESIEQGKHFDSPASVSKIVRPPKTLSLLFPVTHHILPAPTEPRHFAASQFPVTPSPRTPLNPICTGPNFQPSFIREYNIPLDDLLITDLTSYKTFNEFFYRKLKPEARLIDQPENPNRITSPADCRCVVYPIDQVTNYWIKVMTLEDFSVFLFFWFLCFTYFYFLLVYPCCLTFLVFFT